MGLAAGRCKLEVVASKLAEAGDDIAIIVSDEVQANHTEGGLTEAIVNGHNLTETLHKATRMWYKKDYTACGKSMAAMVVMLVGAVEEKDPHENIRTMDDYWKKMNEYQATIRSAEQNINQAQSDVL